MTIAINTNGSVTTVIPQGPIIAENIEELARELAGHMSKSGAKILMDFSKVSHLDSRGLEFLLDTIEESVKKGGSLKLCKVNKLCNDILFATRLNNFIEIYKKAEEAIRSYL